MAGTVATEDFAASPAGMRDEERCSSGESLSEWRSCEQAENGSPSTSPPFWDTDGDDDDPGPKPSELFGRHTWRIEKFSKEKKREMKSEPFEAGGYKWYILVYPQGCDVSNHLSLFLCVANHDKLLPGWSHFAQFTIAVGNIDPKKVKYSDTLHRFWKKEHDWGWKKFMELSKIQDGFLVDDVLEIIAQVQVIREKADRPFRCLDRPYRRELLRVYMTNIEQIYRRFVEERRCKLSKLIDDKTRWSSFRAFWLGIDPSTRHRMSREKTDAILKIMVKHFFVEKEVTSTLVMDSLYTGLKALEYQSKGKKGRTKVVDLEELPAPMVHVDMDMFVLAGDVIALLERAALEPSPCQPVSPKDEKCSQSRTKDGSSAEVNKVSIEREERRLTELGRKILETFVLSHIFSGIEVAYQEAVALKRQEELIREEEAAGLLENEKGKRSGASEKEKRAKKKQAKQKKNNRKGKDKDRDEKYDLNLQERLRDETAIDDSDDLPSKRAEQATAKVDTLEDGASDVSDNGDTSIEMHLPDLGNKNSRRTNGVDDKSREIQNARIGQKNSFMENNSSTSSAESAAVNDVQGKGKNLSDSKSQISPIRWKNQRNKSISSVSPAHEGESIYSGIAGHSGRNMSGCGTAPKFDQETALLTLKDKIRRLGQHLQEGKKLNLKLHLEVVGSKTKTAGSSSSSSSPVEKPANDLKRLEQSSETTTATTINAPPNKAVPVSTSTPDIAVRVIPTTTVSTPAMPVVGTAASKVELVSTKEHVSSYTPQIDKAAPVPSRSPQLEKAGPVPSKSPQLEKAGPVPPRSPQLEKAGPVPLRSPQVDRAAPLPSRSPQVDRAAPLMSKLSQVDKIALLPSRSTQISSTSSEAQEDAISAKVATTAVSQAAVTATSRPSSAPVVQAPNQTTPTPTVQVSPLLPRSMSEAGRQGNDPSPSVSYVPQTYRNAIIGKPTLAANSASFAHQSTSLGHGIALSQPLSSYTSTTSVMLPPPGRNDQLSARQGIMFGLGKSEALDNWHPWKDDADSSRHMWRDESPYQQMNSEAHRCLWKDDSSQQASSSETDNSRRFGVLQPRQFRTEIPPSFVPHQQLGPAADEFPHLDIINDLLEEEQTNGNMAETMHRDYQTFGLPFSVRGNMLDSELTSVSGSGRFNSADHYYDEGFPRAYDTLSLHGFRDGQFSTLDRLAYPNVRADSVSSKSWLYGYPNTSMNLGVNANGFSTQLGDYTNLASGVNGDSVYRRANGHW